MQIMEKKQNVGKGSGIQEKMAAVVTAFSRTDVYKRQFLHR